MASVGKAKIVVSDQQFNLILIVYMEAYVRLGLVSYAKDKSKKTKIKINKLITKQETYRFSPSLNIMLEI